MKRAVAWSVLAGVLALVGLGACASWENAASGPPGVAVANVAEASAEKREPVKAPFTINEAKLPVGYPPPGPVGELIVKEYPAYRAAFAEAQAEPTEKSRQNSMFGVLFRHIQKNDIAMTAPVEMTYEPLGAAEATAAASAATQPAPDGDAPPRPVSMAFLYGAPDWGKLGDDGPVRVVDVPAMTVLSVGVRGDYNGKNFRAALQQISEHLRLNPSRFEAAGPPRYLGYNSPFVPWFLRYGEVQVPVRVK